jgi:hypothetical protein
VDDVLVERMEDVSEDEDLREDLLRREESLDGIVGRLFGGRVGIHSTGLAS